MAAWMFITRATVAVLNLVMVLAALALIGVGFWMRYDDSFDKDLKSVIYKYDDPKELADAKFNIRVWLIVVFWSIIGLSFGAVATGISGMLQLPIKRRWLLILYLVLVSILVVLEFGSSISLLVRRGKIREQIGTMVSAMYVFRVQHDLDIIQDTYHCCGIQNTAIQTNCGTDPKPTCDTAVFNSVDNTIMISGIIFLIILIFQIIALILPVPILIKSSGKKSFRSDSGFISGNVQVDRF